ncbi:MAG: class I SAM-dependent methyltransferase [Polyangiales bacterium]
MTAAQVEQPAIGSGGSCWVCDHPHSTPWKPRSIDRKLVAEDLRISDAHYGRTLALRRCDQCGFLFAEAGDLHELFQLYTELDDPGYEESQDSRILQMNWLLEALERHLPMQAPGADTGRSIAPGHQKGRLLDVGAASGLLVSVAAQRGWQATGVEPSHNLVRVARERHGVELVQGSIPHPALADQRFDAVLLVDVIEHVADPRSLLDNAAQLLAPGGVLMVVTPDVASLAKQLLGRRWWHFRLAHVGYFDRRSFETAAERTGLEVVERFRAKWFFRVSYLAERLTRYLPVGFAVRALDRSALGRFIAGRVVPLNLFDSWVFVCRKSPHEK